MKKRCEGWRRSGGAFSFGVPKWTQCDKDAVVILTVVQEKEEELPACMDCWNEAKECGIKILQVEPLTEAEKA